MTDPDVGPAPDLPPAVLDALCPDPTTLAAQQRARFARNHRLELERAQLEAAPVTPYTLARQAITDAQHAGDPTLAALILHEAARHVTARVDLWNTPGQALGQANPNHEIHRGRALNAKRTEAA